MSLARNRDVRILSHNVIYRLLDMLGVSATGGSVYLCVWAEVGPMLGALPGICVYLCVLAEVGPMLGALPGICVYLCVWTELGPMLGALPGICVYLCLG